LSVVLLLLIIIKPELWWLFIPVTGLYLFALITGSVSVCSNFYLPVFCWRDTNKKIAALTFDDGPDPGITPKILDILAMHDVKATFFLIGRKAEKHKDLVNRITNEGHLTGIHSFRHGFFFDFKSRKKMERDLEKSQNAVKEITGKKPLIFRPPYGVTNPPMAKAVRNLGLKVAGWTVKSYDTTCRDKNRLANGVIKQLHPGAVILLHDTQDITAKALEKIIVTAKEEGYSFAGIDDVLGVKAYKE
jgi:peptidoglycan/xylan/chitin deacetylase (PgdA/CDA1 family)